jgi:hypothetical protein
MSDRNNDGPFTPGPKPEHLPQWIPRPNPPKEPPQRNDEPQKGKPIIDRPEPPPNKG